MTEVRNDGLGKYAQEVREKVCQVISWLFVSLTSAPCTFRTDLKRVIKNTYEN